MDLFEISTKRCYLQLDGKSWLNGYITRSSMDYYPHQERTKKLYLALFQRKTASMDAEEIQNAQYPWNLELEISHEERPTFNLTLRFKSEQDAIAELKEITTQFRTRSNIFSQIERFHQDPRTLNLALTSSNEVERKLAKALLQLVQQFSHQDPENVEIGD